MQTAPHACVVLGGEGFLGTNLCRRLVSSGHRVRSFGRHGLFAEALDGVELRRGDLADMRQLSDAVTGCDVVFHLIHSTLPQSANLNMSADVVENLLPSLALLDVVRKTGVKRVVFVSSGGTIYGRPAQIPTDETAPTDPITAYGITKLAIEKYLGLHERLYGLDYRILRVGNPFGPFQLPLKRQGLVAEIISCALGKEPIEIWGDGSVIRDFIFVEDVVDALVLAAQTGGEDRIFNIGSGSGRSVREVLAAVEQALGVKLDVIWKTSRAVDVPVSTLSVARANNKLGWYSKTSFSHGIARTIAWWQSNAEIIKGVMPAASPGRMSATRVI